jgi:hypothetical protein
VTRALQDLSPPTTESDDLTRRKPPWEIIGQKVTRL